MSKTIVVIGFGPGVSNSVAEKFGAEGFSVALVARNAERLAAGVAALKARGVAAAAFPADAGDPLALRATIRAAQAELGPISALHWNAYGGEPIDLATTDPAKIARVFDIPIIGLLSAVQEALEDLKAAGDGAVLITNGAFGDITPMMDRFATSLNAVGLALGNAAKDKLAGLLAERLKGEGVHVAEVIIGGGVKGTATAGDQGIDPADIAEAFWRLYQGRSEIRARVP
ncbi:SDR family NAD(P)-dependent oxidoreductase [Phenylobacterium montanum]|uniref:SDR family NAD(P)-dependent oxidoreductase n=1 Tax=Phenylobacterium montanum TaxID=2823693 RepID=A0A975FVE6_9CAUL|nr:SDR family NAD(P)-dependent oxidoreductase [Caulobacter sp. S6]QUD86020.1 SDR family NAD(P)-dependent oxidoreductase [Caulobacter sp. S6]